MTLVECVLFPLAAFGSLTEKLRNIWAPSGNHLHWQKDGDVRHVSPYLAAWLPGAVTKLLVMSFLINEPRDQLLAVEHHWLRDLPECQQPT